MNLTRRAISASSVAFSFSSSAYLLRLQPATDRPAGGGWRPGDRETFDFVFFDFFHVMASDKDNL